jgi:hypothetical protein
VKTQLWGEILDRNLLCYTVSKFGDESMVSKYVGEQRVEKNYTVLLKENSWICFRDSVSQLLNTSLIKKRDNEKEFNIRSAKY